jgi:hypothetical protein
MVIGVERECVLCGERGRSCVLPYVCVECDPDFRRIGAELPALVESGRLNAKPAAAEGEGRGDGHS